MELERNAIKSADIKHILPPQGGINRWKHLQVASAVLCVVSSVALLVIYFCANPFINGFHLSPHLILFAGPAVIALAGLITFIITTCSKRTPIVIVEELPEKITTSPYSEPTKPIEIIPLKSSALQNRDPDPIIETGINGKQEICHVTFGEAINQGLHPIFSALKSVLINLIEKDFALRKKTLDPQALGQISSGLTKVENVLRATINSSNFIPKVLILNALKGKDTNKLVRRTICAHNNNKHEEADTIYNQIIQTTKKNNISDIKEWFKIFKDKVDKDRDYTFFYHQLKKMIQDHLPRDWDLHDNEDVIFCQLNLLIEIIFNDETLKLDAMKAQTDALLVHLDDNKPSFADQLKHWLTHLFELNKNNPAIAQVSTKIMQAELSSGLRRVLSHFLQRIAKTINLLSIFYQQENVPFLINHNYLSAESHDLIQNEPFNTELLQLQFKLNTELKRSEKNAIAFIFTLPEVDVTQKKFMDNPAVQAAFELSQTSTTEEIATASTTFQTLQKAMSSSKIADQISTFEVEHRLKIVALPAIIPKLDLVSLHAKKLGASNITNGLMKFGTNFLLGDNGKGGAIVDMAVNFIKGKVEKLFEVLGLDKEQRKELDAALDELCKSPLLFPIVNILFVRSELDTFMRHPTAVKTFADIANQLQHTANHPELTISQIIESLVGTKDEPQKGIFYQLSQLFGTQLA